MADNIINLAARAIEEKYRAMRDRVFGKQSTDNNWDGCKHHWITESDMRWLEREDQKLKHAAR